MSFIWLLLSLAASGLPQETAYLKFLNAVEDGVGCPRLFALRDEAKRSTSVAQQADMNGKLRSAGCFSRTSKRRAMTAPPAKRETYTIREYRIYREVMDSPMYISESQALQRTARKFKTTPAHAKAVAEKVMRVLSGNDWFGSRASEERHASDWGRK